MITTGNKQLIGMAVFFAAVAALGGLLFKRREVQISQQPVEARIVALQARVKTVTEPATRLRLETERQETKDGKVIAKIDAELKAIKEDSQRVVELQGELKGAQAEQEALMPRWVRWLIWPLGLLPVLAFFVAMGLVTENGKRFLVTAAAALVAGGFFYFRGISKGIDLSGGAELRYRLDTSEIDRHIDDLKKRKDAIATPAGLEELKAEITRKEKELKDAPSEVSKAKLGQELDELRKQQTVEGLDALLKDLGAYRQQSMKQAVDVIRRRVDAAGIREVSVQSGESGRLIAQVPIKNILLSESDVAGHLREQAGAAKWDALPKAERDRDLEEEKRRLRLEQLQLDVDQLQRLIETPGMLTFNDVDACNGYQRYAERWKEVLAWDQKIQDLRKGQAAAPTEAERKELQAKVEALQAKPPAAGFVLKELESTDYEGRKRHEQLLLREKPITTGAHLTRALVTTSQDGVGQEVLVYLDAAGAAAMSRYTDENNTEFGVKHKETRMAILLDGVVQSAPVIESQLSSPFRITGRFSQEEADRLAQVLNAGSLAFKPARESVQVVGPGLGEDSITAGVRASLVGSVLVVLFMFVYYLAGGLAANLALFLNILMILGAMALLGGTMTLPGIAGIALTVGMAVDANVLILERVREEKARGKPLKLALKAGQERALVTILDSNFTTLIIAFFLYLFGTGPVKGFAVTLTLGLLTNLFTALYVARAVMEYMLGRGWLTEMKMLKIVGVPKVSFMKAAPAMGVISALLVAGALYLFFDTKDKYGLDFTGGLEVQVRLAEKANTAQVREAADKVKDDMEGALGSAMEQARAKAVQEGLKFKEAEWPTAKIGEFSVQAYEPDASGRSEQFRVSCQLGDVQQRVLEGKQPTEVGAGSQDVTRFFRAQFDSSGLKLDAKDPFPMTSKIGSRAAGELRDKAVLAFFFSLAAMFIYIVLRFDFMVGFGLGAVISLFHDAAVAVGVLMVANRMGMAGAQVDLTIVAAVLTIIGFSINDTIVIFDRIRENRPAMRSMSLREVVDISVNQTLSRTILTSATVFVAVLCLLLLGGGTLRPFALVFTAGVIVGTYSSVFVATSVGVAYENWRDRRREALRQKLRTAPAQSA